MYKILVLLILFVSCKNNIEKKSVFLDKFKKIEIDTISIKPQIDSINNLIEEGDIIFRGGTDVESNIIRDFSYTDKLFSHCGIALNTDSGFVVVHMLGGTTNPNGGILFQKIKDFLSYPENESAGIYKLDISKEEIKRFHHYADSVKNKKIGFDLKFNLFTKDVLYCTEMLADGLCYAKNKINLIKPTSYSLKNTKYYFLANDGDNFKFYPIDKLEYNKLLKEKKIVLFPNFNQNVIQFN